MNFQWTGMFHTEVTFKINQGKLLEASNIWKYLDFTYKVLNIIKLENIIE